MGCVCIVLVVFLIVWVVFVFCGVVFIIVGVVFAIVWGSHTKVITAWIFPARVLHLQ